MSDLAELRATLVEVRALQAENAVMRAEVRELMRRLQALL